MLDPKTSSARGPVGVPRASSSSYADRPLPGRESGVDTPDPRHVRTRGRVVDHPVAGQLVGLLPVLASALPVALAGQAAVARSRLAAHPQRERHVDPGQHGVRPGRVLLGAAGGQHHHLVGAAEQRGQRAHLRGRHPGHALDALRPPRTDRVAHRVPAGGARGDVRRSRPSRPPPAGAGLRAPARGRRPGPAARTRRHGRLSPYAADRSPRPGRLAPGGRRGDAPRAASSRPGSTPTRTTTSASSTSASGNGSPRSRPKARVPAEAADDMHQRPL